MEEITVNLCGKVIIIVQWIWMEIVRKEFICENFLDSLFKLEGCWEKCVFFSFLSFRRNHVTHHAPSLIMVMALTQAHCASSRFLQFLLKRKLWKIVIRMQITFKVSRKKEPDFLYTSAFFFLCPFLLCLFQFPDYTVSYRNNFFAESNY